MLAEGFMDTTDARKLPLAILDERRRRAVKLQERGMTLREVASEVELSIRRSPTAPPPRPPRFNGVTTLGGARMMCATAAMLRRVRRRWYGSTKSARI